jgi:hypothetical protein
MSSSGEAGHEQGSAGSMNASEGQSQASDEGGVDVVP